MVETDKGGVVSNERIEVLARQVDAKIKQNSDLSTEAAGVPFSKLMSTATAGEKCKFYLGWIFAACTGAVLPLFFFFIGPIFDSFGPDTDPKETRETVRELCAVMGFLSLFLIFTSILQNYLLVSTSAQVGGKLRTRYLKSIL